MSARLDDTRRAFDSVAGDYDGERGNNAAIQDMRSECWRWLAMHLEPASHVLDIGCGTGLDALHLAAQGHSVMAIDWSARMVRRTRERANGAGLSERVQAMQLGAQELVRLPGGAIFDAAYSDLGPLNCVPDLRAVACECARLLKPGATLVCTVIGRICPWEVLYFAGQRRWRRIAVRYARGMVPVPLNGLTVWMRYYLPAEFSRAFQGAGFRLMHVRGLCVFAPPPYLIGVRERHPRLYRSLWRLDRALAGLPVLRGLGDHFLAILRRCDEAG